MPKISIIGAGKVGGTAAFLMAIKNLGDVVLIDSQEDLARGRALDIIHCSSIENFQHSVIGSNDYKDIAGSDVVVITAGASRLGESRTQLLEHNLDVMKEVAQKVMANAPDAFIVVVTNPLDVLTWVVKMVTNLPSNRVVGMAGILDSSRMNYYSSLAAGTYPKQFSCMIVGNHGENMVNVMSQMNLDGTNVTDLIKNGTITEEQIRDASLNTTKSGFTIYKLTKTSTMYAPASSITGLVDAYINNRKKVIPCSVYLEGEYGVDGLCIGVPVVIGSKGMEEIVQVSLSEEERKAFDAGVQNVRTSVDSIKDRI